MTEQTTLPTEPHPQPSIVQSRKTFNVHCNSRVVPTRKLLIVGGSTGLVVMGVRIPALYTGWKFFTYVFVVKICNVFEKTKINEKVAGVGPFFSKKLLIVRRR